MVQVSFLLIAPKSVTSESEFTKQQPFEAEILLSQKLTGRDSDRDVRHVEIDLGESGIKL